MNVDISKFDNYIGLYAPTATTSASGSVTRTYALNTSVWAHIDTRANNEQFVVDKRSAMQTITINIRQDAGIGITNLWRFECDGITYQITGIVENNNFPRGEVWRITGEVIQ